jgi:molybdate/tungstate transport system substrate-binding protein
MYAGSLIKTFKSTPGSLFQKETRYGYQGMRFSNLNRQGSYTLRSGQTIYGEPIFFSHTILDTGRNIDGSIAFVKFLLLENGQQLFKNDGLNPIKARIERDFEKIPSVIKSVLLEIRVEQ